MSNRVPMFILLAVAAAIAVMPLFSADIQSYNKDNVSNASVISSVPITTGFAAKFNSQQVLSVTNTASKTLTIPTGTKKVVVYTTQSTNFGYTDVSGSCVADAAKPALAASTFYTFAGTEDELGKLSFIAASSAATMTVRYQ